MLPRTRLDTIIGSIEALVQQDEGNRGIKPILEPPGELLHCCELIESSHHVIIITGFPCMISYDPPTETDGPLGALSMVKSLLHLGKAVTVLTDLCNEEVVRACARGANLQDFHEKLTIQAFPPGEKMDDEQWARLHAVAESADLLISIERAGPSKDGRYLTMRCRDMTAIVSPLDKLLTGLPPLANTSSSSVTTTHHHILRSIGIGDGGNEVGMGKAYDKIIKSSIPNATENACVVSTDLLLVASVSNWGGYAISAAIAVYNAFHHSSGEEVDIELIRSRLNCLLPTDQEEIEKCQLMVEAGARDGITGDKALMVDGMPLQTSLDLIQKFRTIV
eukprot:gene2020-2202_t